ncbi:hypothetical protein [Tenuibacillus multivorans]|nr:hypothetical protein [Tenuibacillus multivorans]
MLKKISIVLLFFLMISGCDQEGMNHCDVAEGEGKIEHEVYTAITLDDDLDQDGYKRVNSNLLINDNEDELCVEVEEVVDYYSLDHEYLRSEVLSSYSRKDKLTKRQDEAEKVEEINGPATILLPDSVKGPDYPADLSEEEKQRVKEHVDQLVEKHLN